MPPTQSASPLSDYWLSAAWEAATGNDSIKTIERVYGKRRRSGAYECVWPGCDVARKDSAAMWRHVHTAHGTDSLPPADFDPEPWMADVDES